MSSEAWVPQPDEWYGGTVVSVHGDYSFAELSEGSQVFVHMKSVRFREGGHVCFRRGDEVALRIEPGRRRYSAIEAVLQTPHDDKTESDTGIITFWSDRNHGYIKRFCGCHIFVPDGSQRFRVGDLVSFRISLNPNSKCQFYEADCVELAGDNNDLS